MYPTSQSVADAGIRVGGPPRHDGMDGWIPRSGGAILLLTLVMLATRAWEFGNPAVHVDEQYYLLVGDRMLGGALPYVDLWDRKPVGLFAIFAATRLLPGDGVLAYQLVAAALALATAWLVRLCAEKLGASRAGALAAGAAYLVWLPLLSGRGGQSPVFYNLFVTGAALLTLGLPALAEGGEWRKILARGAAACLLAGLAIQTKYTPIVEGAFFGLAHLFYLRRAGASWIVVSAAALLWMTLGALPTLIVVADYWHRGPVTFDAFWFANFASVALRRSYPAAKIAGRLAGTWAQLSPFVIAGIAFARDGGWPAEKRIAYGWLAAALIAYAMIGAFFDHYALPLVAPLAIVAAPVLGRRAVYRWVTLVAGAAVFVAKLPTAPYFGSQVRAVSRVVEANSHDRCPYVFAGDSVVYLLAHACTPTRYAFPSTLAYEPERGATGVDEAAEVRRILDTRPPVIVTLSAPLAPWNAASRALVEMRLRAGYRLVFRAPREEEDMLVYLRSDLPYIIPVSATAH